MKVLLCSGPVTFAEVFAALLQAAGNEVITVRKVDRAVEDVGRENIDVCIIDLERPVGDVVGAVSAIVAEGTPVVALVDPAGDHLLAQLVLAAGASVCVSKALGADAVLGAIEAAAVGHRGLLADELGPRGARADPSAMGWNTGGPQLTTRELQVLEGLARGERTADLAARLGVRPSTARKHVERLLAKLGVHSRASAVALAVSRGIIEP